MKTSIKYIFLICIAMASWHKAHAQSSDLKTLLNNGASHPHYEDFVKIDADNTWQYRALLFGKPYDGGNITGYIMTLRGVGARMGSAGFDKLTLGYYNETNNTYNNFIQCIRFWNLVSYDLASPAVTILSTGNVGIGNTSPNTLLTVGADNATATATLLDVHGSAHFNNDLGTSDATMTSVTINTDTVVKGCALTVAGPTYIGDWRTIEANRVNSDYINTYNLWVDKGVVSPDFVMNDVCDWADDVFTPGYKLPELKEVERHIAENGHLSGIPSTAEVKEKGYSTGALDRNLLRKVEELTMYTIAMEKKADKLQQQLNELQALKAELKELKVKMKK
jgi:hypothetical protein